MLYPSIQMYTELPYYLLLRDSDTDPDTNDTSPNLSGHNHPEPDYYFLATDFSNTTRLRLSGDSSVPIATRSANFEVNIVSGLRWLCPEVCFLPLGK